MADDYEGDATELLETYGARTFHSQLDLVHSQTVAVDFLMKYIIIGAT